MKELLEKLWKQPEDAQLRYPLWKLGEYKGKVLYCRPEKVLRRPTDMEPFAEEDGVAWIMKRGDDWAFIEQTLSFDDFERFFGPTGRYPLNVDDAVKSLFKERTRGNLVCV